MSDYFKNINEIIYEGPDSDNPLSFKYYDESRKVLGKTMKEHLRFATCYWHTFTWPGLDPFGGATFERPWMSGEEPLKMAEMKLDEAFDFSKNACVKKCNKIGVDGHNFKPRKSSQIILRLSIK